MVKSGLEKIFLKSLHAQSLFRKIFFTSQKGGFLHQIANTVIKMTFFAHGGISIKLFVVYLHIINKYLSYKFNPYSILTGLTKVESAAYQVLSFPKSIGNSSVKVAVIDCFQSCSFPSLSIKEGFGFGFGPFVGILMEFKGNEQDETDLWCRQSYISQVL